MISVRPGNISVSTAAAYCNWLVMLWGAFDLPNPWRPARDAALSNGAGLKKNRSEHGLVKAVAKAIAGIDPTTAMGARDMWLLCGVAILGLSTIEVAGLRRENVHIYGVDRRLWIDSRPGARDVDVGVTASTWLSRMEGVFAKAYSDETWFAADAPLWPSLHRWGTKPDSRHMSPQTVVRILRGLGLSAGDLRWFARSEIRAAGATIAEAGLLMGTRGGVETTPDETRIVRLVAQSTIATKLGI
jgi:hypothetical protein